MVAIVSHLCNTFLLHEACLPDSKSGSVCGIRRKYSVWITDATALRGMYEAPPIEGKAVSGGASVPAASMLYTE